MTVMKDAAIFSRTTDTGVRDVATSTAVYNKVHYRLEKLLQDFNR